MPNLNFRVESAEPVPFAAAPLLSLKLRVDNTAGDETIHSVVLRAQIQIDATRRRYGDPEKALLSDLFGEPDRWSRTLRPLLWTHASTVIPAFTGSATAELQVPCTFDFNVAATKYFHALQDGEIPLQLLFSGSVFYVPDSSILQVAPISWDKESRFQLPVRVWRSMMDEYYPNCAWIALPRDLFERWHEFKVANGTPTLEAALEQLLDSAAERAVATR